MELKLNLTYNNTTMKLNKILYTFLLLLAFGCQKDTLEDFEGLYTVTPDNLKIEGISGIKLASNIVSDEVKINVKLPEEGTYKIKLIDFSGKLISSEKVTAQVGDNILNIYVSALPISSYKIQLLTETNSLIGTEVFSILD